MHWNWPAFGAAVAVAALAKLLTMKRGSFDEKVAGVSAVILQGAIAGTFTPQSLTTAIAAFLFLFHASDVIGCAIGYNANKLKIKRGIEWQLKQTGIGQVPRGTRSMRRQTTPSSTSPQHEPTQSDS